MLLPACYCYCLQMLAMGFREYFKDNWNKLDFCIILSSIPDLIAAVVPAVGGAGFVTVFRVMR